MCSPYFSHFGGPLVKQVVAGVEENNSCGDLPICAKSWVKRLVKLGNPGLFPTLVAFSRVRNSKLCRFCPQQDIGLHFFL